MTILFLLPFFANLADAALAALVVVVMLEISDMKYFFTLWRVYRVEFVLGILAFVGVLLYDVLEGVLIGVILSLIVLAHHIYRPQTAVVGRDAKEAFVDLDEHEDAEEIPGMLIWRQYAPLVFLNARNLSQQLLELVRDRENVRVVVLDATAASGIDTTAIGAFNAAQDDLAGAGVELWVVNVREAGWKRISAKMVAMGKPPVLRFDSLDDAVNHFQSLEG